MKIPYQDKKISLEKLMNVIKKNITGVEINETKLKEELLYNFSSNIATEKNEKLTEEFIIPQGLLAEVTNCTLQEGIKIGAELLLKEKCISKIYLEELVTKVNEELLYLFLNENTILVYADPKDNVLKTAFSLVKMKKSLIFKDKKVKNLVCFAPKGDTQDQKILFELNDYFEKSRVLKIK